MLGLCPGCESFVGVECLVLGAQNIGDSVLSGIVHNSDVVAATTQAVDWRGAPQVGVNLITEMFGNWSLALLENDLASHFCIFT